jgi:hypothetical protein
VLTCRCLPGTGSAALAASEPAIPVGQRWLRPRRGSGSS